jgi:hypothetical protein
MFRRQTNLLRLVRLGVLAGALLLWWTPARLDAGPVPSRTEAEERAATEEAQDPVVGGDDTEVQVFGIILLVFVLLMYLWKSRD